MKLSHLMASVASIHQSSDGAVFYPSRPATAENTFLVLRIKAAWRVLVGKSDAVEWPEQKELK